MNYKNIALENMNLEERAAYWDELDKQQRKRDKMFCKSMKNIRAMLGLTKKQMAQMCNISIYILNLLEKGSIPERLTTIIFEGLEECFGLSPWDMTESNACEIIKKRKKNI